MKYLLCICFINTASAAEPHNIDQLFEVKTVQNHTFLHDINNQDIITEYKTFFKNEKIAQKYLNKVSMLPIDDQITMFKAFSLGKNSIAESWKPRMIFVVRLYGLFNSKNSYGYSLVESKLKPFFEKEAALTSQEFKNFLVEDITKHDKKMDVELAKIQKNNAQLDKDNAQLDKDNAQLDKDIKAEKERGKKIDNIFKILSNASKESN